MNDTNNVPEYHIISGIDADKPIDIEMLRKLTNNNKSKANDAEEKLKEYVTNIIDKLVTQENILKYGNFKSGEFYVPIFFSCIHTHVGWMGDYTLYKCEGTRTEIVKMYRTPKNFLECIKKTVQSFFKTDICPWITYKKEALYDNNDGEFVLMYNFLMNFAKEFKTYRELTIKENYNVKFEGCNTHGLSFKWC